MRPRVTINVAQSLNGYISGSGGKRVSISNEEDLIRVNKLRSSSDAILVGANTVMLDNPSLRVKPENADHQPVRIILDSRLRISPDASLFNGTSEVVIFTSNNKSTIPGARLVVKDKANLQLDNILGEIYDMGIRKLLVEGGSNVISQFLETGLFDDFFIFIGNLILPLDGTPLFQKKLDESYIYEFVETVGNGILIKLKRD